MINIISYDKKASIELDQWKVKMNKKPNLIDKASKGVQNKVNGILPKQYHDAITFAIKNMMKVVLVGSQYTTKEPVEGLTLEQREALVDEKTTFYRTTAIIEGVSTGMGGILLGLADLPLLLSIKVKFLYEIAAIYGYDVRDYKERVYILNVILLAFSSKSKRIKVFKRMEGFEQYSEIISEDINSYEWMSFQREYRDYLDISKMFQMVPGVGALVGGYVNNNLINRLSDTAKQAYRMRLFM